MQLNDGSFGYVSSKYLSRDFKTYPKSIHNKKKGMSNWQGILVLLIIGIVIYNGMKKTFSGGSSNQKVAKPQKVAAVKNELISQVKLEGSWYRFYNPDGKQLSVKAKHSDDFILAYSEL